MVKTRLAQLGIETDHDLRVIIGAIIEELTGRPCDKAVASLSDEEILRIVTDARKRNPGSQSRQNPPKTIRTQKVSSETVRLQ